MRDLRKLPGLPGQLLPLAALVLASCQGPPPRDVRLLSATPYRGGGDYSVMVLLENSTPEPLSLEEVSIRMTTYDSSGQVLARDYPFAFSGLSGEVNPHSTTRIPLHRPDPADRVYRSRLFLRDERGRLLSELEVPPEEDS